jgi:hypothetical protein
MRFQAQQKKNYYESFAIRFCLLTSELVFMLIIFYVETFLPNENLFIENSFQFELIFHPPFHSNCFFQMFSLLYQNLNQMCRKYEIANELEFNLTKYAFYTINQSIFNKIFSGRQI